MNKRNLMLVVGGAITLVALYFAFRDIQLSILWDTLKQTNWLWAIVVVILTVISFLWRAVRWRILLQPTLRDLGKENEVGWFRLFGPLMIGFGFNNILPARLGEFLRPLALKKQDDIPYPAGLSTVVLERLIDSIVLLGLFVFLPFYMTIDPELKLTETIGGREYTLDADTIQSVSTKFSIIAGILMAGVLSCVVPALKNLYIRIIHALPLIPAGIKHKLEGLIETVAKGFESLKSFTAIIMIFVHSAGIWLAIAATYQVMSWGFPGVDVGFGDSLGMLTLICVAISLPSSPGFWGLFEFGGKFALLMMSAVPNDVEGKSAAVAFTMVVHFLQWAPITAIGLYYAAKIHVSASEASEAELAGEAAMEELGEEAEGDAEARES